MIQKFLPSSLALLFAAAPLVAQEASDFGASSADTSVSTDVSSIESASDSLAIDADSGPDSFFFPGGYGYLPETISPGTGLYARPPIDFNLTIQTGYIDNIYSRSYDTQGSGTVQATAGVNLLLNTPRTFLSMGANAGGMYYFDKKDDPFVPVGSMTAAFAHSFSPRLQLTSRVNAGYYSQPNLSLPNAPVNSGDYFNLTSLFNLSYRWTPLFSTDTSFGANTQIFRESGASGDSDYVEFFVGEAFRYVLAPRFTGVAEVRFSTFSYDDTFRDSDTTSVMAGFDWQIGPRLTSTFRGGASFRQFDFPGSEDRVSPYFETGLGYRYGRGSLLQWNTRYGFEESSMGSTSNQTFRTGLMVSQVITPRLNGTLGMDYAYETHEHNVPGLPSNASYERNQHLISGSARLEFIATRSLTIFGNYSRTQNVSSDSYLSYTRNEVSIGATYHF